MTKIFLIIVTFVLMSFGVSGQVTSEDFDLQSNTRTLKVMSYNIRIASPPSTNWGGTDLAAIANVINAHQPDLVALQEVDAYTQRSGKSSHQAKELAEMTGMNYYFAKAVDRSEGDYGVAVLSRFPIIKGEGYRLPVTESSEGEIRAAAIIVINAFDEEFAFASTHFDHMSDADRLLQSNKFIGILNDYSKYPIIVGADFNMKPDNKVMKVLRKELVGCVDCPLTFPQIDPRTTIDYVMLNNLASRKLRLIKYYVVKEDYASDHLPLIAEFQFPVQKNK